MDNLINGMMPVSSLFAGNGELTMSSLAIVELINAKRSAGSKVLLHKNFLAKLESHPSIDSAKFLAEYQDSTGRTLKCYFLPERERHLMVMSESLAVQAAVYDWAKAKCLENEALLLTNAKQANELAKLQEDTAQRLLSAATLETKAKMTTTADSVYEKHYNWHQSNNPATPKHESAIYATRMVQRELGLDATREVTQSRVMDDVKDSYMAPSAIGLKLLGYQGDYMRAGQAVNLQLVEHGLQEKANGYDGFKRGTYKPTELGRKYSNIHAWVNDSKEGFNLKWSPQVLKDFKFVRVDEFLETPQYDPSVHKCIEDFIEENLTPLQRFYDQHRFFLKSDQVKQWFTQEFGYALTADTFKGCKHTFAPVAA
jgi:hypothetical protein